MVLGISPDTPKAQLSFKKKEKLPFTLLADDKKEVARKFDVLKEKNMYGKKVIGIVRSTFLIGPEGKIAHVFSPVTPAGHAEEVLGVGEGGGEIASVTQVRALLLGANLASSLWCKSGYLRKNV